MNVLDENIPEAQRQLLLSRRVRVRQIGLDIGQQGMKDRDEIIPLLQSVRQAVLFTRDKGLYDRTLCHRKYAIVCLVVSVNEVATFVRRFLRHPEFDTKASRTGKVFRVSEIGIRFWAIGDSDEAFSQWEDGASE